MAVGVAGSARSGDGRDLPFGRDLADAVVVGVRDVDVAAPVHGHADGGVEARGGGVAVGVARRAFARDRADLPFGRDLADAVVARVGDVEIACVVNRQPRRRVERGRRARAVGEALGASGERRHRAVGREPADAIALAAVGDVERPVRADREAEGVCEARAQVLRVVADAGRAVARARVDGGLPTDRRRRRRRASRERRRMKAIVPGMMTRRMRRMMRPRMWSIKKAVSCQFVRHFGEHFSL